MMVWPNQIIQIGNEKMMVNYAYTPPGTTWKVGVKRGQYGTSVEAHPIGGAVTILPNCGSNTSIVCADHPVDSIDKVWCRINGGDVDITADCNLYTGKTGSQNQYSPNKACITFKDLAALQQRLTLSITDTKKVVDVAHNHTPSGGSTTTTSQTGRSSSTSSNGTTCSVLADFDVPPGGSITTQTVTISWQYLNAGDINTIVSVYVCDNLVYRGNAASNLGSWTGVIGPAVPSVSVVRSGGGWYSGFTGYITSCSRQVTTSNTLSVAPNLSGVSMTGAVVLNGATASNYILGDMIMADTTRAVIPSGAMNEILSRSSFGNVTVVGNLPAAARLDGAITEYNSALYWLSSFAFQLRSLFRIMAGSAKLIVRSPNPASQMTLTDVDLSSEGRRIISMAKALDAEIVNTINLQYGRDWTMARGDSAYTKNLSGTRANSIALYGKKEDSRAFQMDFITDDTWAAALLDYSLRTYSLRPWRIMSQHDLRYLALEYGDVATLAFESGQNVQIDEMGFDPQNKCIALTGVEWRDNPA
jgi:hypothetical protein